MAQRQDYAAIAQQVIAKNRPLLDLEFHPAAIAAVDAFIDLTWGEEGAAPADDNWRPSAGKGSAIVGFGAFFGEVMRQKLGGQWQDDPAQPDNPFMARVVLASGHEVFAIGKVYKRLKNGAEDRLEPLFLYLRDQAGAKALPAEAGGWVRQAKHFESVSRPDLAARFYERAVALAPAPALRAQLDRLRAEEASATQAAAEQERSRATAEARAKIAELAEQGRAALAARGVRVDRGALTLFGIDSFLDESFGRDPLPEAKRQPPLGLALGAFVGELLRTRYRGEWREQPVSAVARSQVVWPSGLATCPFELVFRRLAQGARAPVLEQVAALLKSLIAQGDTEDPPEEAKDWFEQADDYAQKVGRFDLAVRVAKAGLGMGGDSAAVRLKLAAWHRALGQLDAATAELDAALRMGPPGAFAWRERAQLAAARGEHSEALAAFEKAVALDPANGEALMGKARALVALERTGEAREWLDRFPGRSDTEPDRSYLAALTADTAGDRVAAHGLFDRLKDHARLPAESRAHAAARQLALASDPAVRLAAIERIPDVEQTVAEYARFNAEHPTLAEPWRERGVGLAMVGRTDEALECLRRAAALEPAEPKSYDHEAVTLARLQRFDEAIAALDRGLGSCPGSGLLLMRKGVFLSMAGRLDEALRSCEAALVADPAHADSWAFKGDIEYKLGRIPEAIASIQRYLAAKPGSREKRVDAARRQLWAIMHPGQERDLERAQQCESRALERSLAGAFPEALPLFDEAVAADPLFGEAWFNRATCLHHLSRFDEAVASLEKAEDLTGPTSLVADGLAASLLRLGRAEEALAAYDRLLARQPASPEARRGKARTLVRLGRPAEALPLYERLLARAPEDAELAREHAEALRAAAASGPLA